MDNYAVIGNPVSHSASPFIHQQFAIQTQQSLQYERIEAPLDGFEKIIKEFQAAGGKGASVTIPFKEQAFQLADQRSELAQQAEAANTLAFKEDGSIFADNTDGTGLVQDLTHNYDYCARQKKILLLGAGGATRGILGPLLDLAPKQLIIANRTKEKAILLAERVQLKGDVIGISLDEIEASPYDLIINTTSAGMTGNPLTLAKEIIGPNTYCYDIMYGKQTPPFLAWAQQHNPQHCMDGLGMLVEQAAAAFYLWCGVYPDTHPVIDMLREKVNT